MARELHDIIAYSLSLIVVQAGVGAHISAEDPPAARRALTTIDEVSRQALSEMRHVVKVLRDGSDEVMAPAPGLAHLAGLTDAGARSGLHVDVVREGSPDAIPAAVDATAYRIVQESLTNASATRTRARFGYGWPTPTARCGSRSSTTAARPPGRHRPAASNSVRLYAPGADVLLRA
jgi:signal transduction histidine kinase